MKVNSFKEILLKKSSDNTNLKSFIFHMKDEYLVDYVYESLQKMAANTGGHKKPNTALQSFAKTIKPGHIDMIHDALSHHATKYTSALKAQKDLSASGKQKEAKQAGDVANDHMSRFYKTVHMLDKVLHDGNKNHTPDSSLKMKVVDPKPWERNRFTNKGNKGEPNPYKQDHYGTDTKGWAREGDYSFLQNAPHHSYVDEVHGHGHTKAYPLEETKINDKHVHIDHDDQYSGAYTPHAFDSHPVFDIYKKPNEQTTGPAAVKFMMDSMNFDKSNLRDFMDNHNPEATRGASKSAPAHAEVAPLDIQKHLSATNPMLHQKLFGATAPSAGGGEPPPIPSEAMDDKAKSRAALASIRTPKAPGGS
jgi:hypothetical protein